MKALINVGLEIIRKGEFVSANESAGEFLFDSESCDLTLKILVMICQENLVSVPRKSNKKETIAILAEHINTMEIPTMNDKTDSQKVEEIVAAGVEAGSSDEDMLIEIIQAGIKFKAAGRMFKEAMESGGYRITAKLRKEQCRDVLVECEFSPADYDAVLAMVDSLVGKVADTTTSQAHAMIRSYAKEFEIDLPTPVKQQDMKISEKICNWIIANPGSADEATLTAFLESIDVVDKSVVRYVKKYTICMQIANKIINN